VGIVTMIGFALLIIPGIIFSVWFAFSYYVLLFEGKTGIDAMKASKAYVKGRWWAVFGRFAFIVLVSIIFSVVFGGVSSMVGETAGTIASSFLSMVLNFILVPVTIAYSFLIYKDLSGGDMGQMAAANMDSGDDAEGDTSDSSDEGENDEFVSDTNTQN